MSFRLLYNNILKSTIVMVECISWLINMADYNDARWKPEAVFYSTSSQNCSSQCVFRHPDFLTEKHVLNELDLNTTPASKSTAGIQSITTSERVRK